MTRFEADATNGFAQVEGRGADWTQILVPIVAAALVIALGLALVAFTSEPESPLVPPPAAEGTF